MVQSWVFPPSHGPVLGFSTIRYTHHSSKAFTCYDEGRKSYNGVYDLPHLLGYGEDWNRELMRIGGIRKRRKGTAFPCPGSKEKNGGA
jgi:hypothetical protein